MLDAKALLARLGLLLSLGCASAGRVTISNMFARTTTDGRLMDAHDGNIMQWEPGGLYYWYGMGYQNCTESTGLIPPLNCPGIYKSFGSCGFRTDHALNIYSSPDLVNWTFVGDGLPMDSRPLGIYFRPKVVYNARTQEYVLWINFLYQHDKKQTPLGAYPNATYLVGASKAATGPFEVVNSKAHVEQSGGGDFTLLVDDDGEAYIAYDAWSNSHSVTVQLLDDKYYNARVGISTLPLSPSSNEAPLFFKRDGWYFLLFGHTCCFCSTGAGAHLLVSRHPLANWTDTHTELNPRRSWSTNHVITSQNNYVFSARTTNGTHNSSTLVFTGDRWTSAPDKLKSHDLQFWAPLEFEAPVAPALPPSIRPLRWLDSFELQLR